MTDGSFELGEFEYVQAIPGKALLRIAAAPTFDASGATLLIDGETRVSPLPAPPGPPGLVRVAFSIPAEAAERAQSYQLELSAEGTVVDLPAPNRRQSTRILPPTPAPPPNADAVVSAADAELVADLERRLEAERSRRLSADTAAATSAAAREASETRLKRLDGQLVETRSDLESTKRSLDSTRGDLRAAQGEAELGRTQASHARAEAEAAETTLVQREAEIELLRQSLEEHGDHAEHSYLQWEQITAELTAEIEVARQVASNFQQHARNLQLELADSKLELTSLRALREAHELAVAAGTAVDGDSGDPAVVASKLNAAAAALEEARSRASEAESALAQRETEMDRLRTQLQNAK